MLNKSYMILKSVESNLVVKQCPQPSQVIANGRSLTLQLTFVQGDSVQYLCEVGYVIQGSTTTTISCQGGRSPAVPTCVGKSCQGH